MNAPPADQSVCSSAGMRRSRLAGQVAWLAKRLNLGPRWNLAHKAIRAASKLEGGEFFSLTARDLLRYWYDVNIGPFSYGGCFTPGAFPPKTHIGRYCSVAKGVRCIERNHPYDRPSTSSFFYDPRFGIVDEDTLPGFEPLWIGHDVWIGWNAILLPGCRKIGTGAIIGAGAVVTRDVPAFAIVAGTPAKILKHRFDEPTRERLLATDWHYLPPSGLREHSAHFKRQVSDDFIEQFSEKSLPDRET